MEEVAREAARFSLTAAKLVRPENLLSIVFEKIWLGSGRSPHFFSHVLLYIELHRMPLCQDGGTLIVVSE
jgi:hypothetical protein